jgi:NodT family efflux transporter outer membrane factor (OMF) lipoprotein
MNGAPSGCFVTQPLLGALIAAACAASACVIGPKYTPPAVPVPATYSENGAPALIGDWKIAQPDDAASRGRWWTIFGDPHLNELEERLTLTNQTVAAAAAGVQVARALVRQARAQYFPTFTFNPSVTNTRIATANGRPIGLGFTAYSLPLEASWEADLWGRVRHTVASARFAAQASEADLENVRLSAQAELASLYWQLHAQDALTQLLDTTVLAYEDALAVTRDRFAAGLENDEAVAQAETQLTATRAQATNLGIVRAQYVHAIAVLVDEPPSTFSMTVDAATPIPPVIPVGLPAQLLERRPDIAASARAVAEANEQIGLARTAFFPALILGGNGGFLSLTPADLLTWPSRFWAVGPNLAQVIFDGGLRRAVVQQQRAAYDTTVATYRQTVLTAFQEVEDNLAALRILRQVIDEQGAAVASAQRSLQVADVRYLSGIDLYLNVITAQTALLTAQQTLVTLRGQQLVASVQLIKALGGGWNPSP